MGEYTHIRIVNDMQVVKISESLSRYFIYVDLDLLSYGDSDINNTVLILSEPKKVRMDGIFCFKYEITAPSKESPIYIGDIFQTIDNRPVTELEVTKKIEEDMVYTTPTLADLLVPGKKFEELIPANTYSIALMDFSKTPAVELKRLAGNEPYWLERIVPDFNPPWQYKMGEYEITDMASPLIMKTSWESEMSHLINEKRVRIKHENKKQNN